MRFCFGAILVFLIDLQPLQAQIRSRYVSPDLGARIFMLYRPIEDNEYSSMMRSNVYNTGWINNLPYSTPGNHKTDTVFVAIDSGFYKSNTDQVLVLLQKEKYKPLTQLLTLSEIKGGRKRVKLANMKPLLYHHEGGSNIEVERVSMNVDRKHFRQKYYLSYEDFVKRDLEHEYVSDREIYYNNTVFENDIEAALEQRGFADTTRKMSLNPYQRIDLEIVIKDITEHKFGRYCVVELNATVKFPVGFCSQIEKKYHGFSNIGYDDSYENDLQNKGLMSEAATNIIDEILADPELKEKFADPIGTLKKLSDWNDEITIHSGTTTAHGLEEATAAVVTVLVKDGHGSGCAISADGYIITNFHVTGADTSQIFALFNNGSKKRCRFVRGNPSYDLALLKADTTINAPLKLAISSTVSIGADVFAIGTPKDVRLGQTVTKGIISAKRTIEGRTFIQSDVSVNRGNSGGALTNSKGELLGIVNSKMVGMGVEGLSFAIPVNYIEEALKLKLVKE